VSHMRRSALTAAFMALLPAASLFAQPAPTQPTSTPPPAAAAATPAPVTQPPTAVVHLKDGDRISGRVGRSGKDAQRVTTAWGRLVIPNEKIEKIVFADGREETFLPPATPTPAALPTAMLPARVQLAMTGDSYWYAWDPKEAPEDPTLRLLVSLDDRHVAAYVDSHLDEEKGVPGVVNTFAFDPAQTSRTVWDEARVLPPEAAPGRVRLLIELPDRMLGGHHLTLAYQWNAGTRESPEWRELLHSSLDIAIDAATPTAVRVEQSRGEMTFGGVFKKSMHKTETFRLQVFPDHEPGPAVKPGPPSAPS